MAVIGAAATAEHGEASVATAQRSVTFAEITRIAVVELGRIVELGMAHRRGVGANSADSVDPARVGVEFSDEVCRAPGCHRSRAADHDVDRRPP